MEYFFRTKPFDDDGKPIRGYMQRMMQEWKKNSSISDLELEIIWRMIEGENEIMTESIEDVEENHTDKDIVRTSKRIEQIGDGSDDTTNNVAANVEILDKEPKLVITQLNKILASNRNNDGIYFRKFDMNSLNKTIAKVNKVIELIGTNNITQTNNHIKTADVANQLGLRKYEDRKKKDPWLKRLIEEDVKQLKKDINIFERVKRGQIGSCKEGNAKLVVEKYRVKGKGSAIVTEELKQRILAKAAKSPRYVQKVQQHRINRLFKVDQKKVYNELNGQRGSGNGDIPNAEESSTFWSGIWSVEEEDNKKAKWFSDLKEKMVKLVW